MCAATGRIDDARHAFAASAQEKIDAKPPDFTPVGFDLGVGNLWRLAGDEERAIAHLGRARAELEGLAQSSDQRKPPYLFTLLLVGDDDALVNAADDFGDAACGERAWAAVQAVRAGTAGDPVELERRLAQWDALADAEKVATDGIHPSNRDVRDLLRARFGGGDVGPPAGSAPASEGVAPTVVVQAEAAAEGDVLGWWGHYVVTADAERVALFDTTTGQITHRLVASTASGPTWNPSAARFSSGTAAYALLTTPSGVVASRLPPGGTRTFSSTGHLLATESGRSATVHRSDGYQVAAGRSPVAFAPSGDAVAIANDDGTIRVVTFGAEYTPTGSYVVDEVCSTVAWFPTGDRLACAEDAGQTVRTVALPTGAVLDEAVLHEDDPIVAVAVAPSGSRFASVGFDGVLGVRDLDARTSASHGFEERLDDVAWDASGELLAVHGEHGWFVVTAAGARLDVDSASSAAWHPVERRLAVVRGGRLVVLTY